MDLRDELPPDFDWPETIRRLRERAGHRDNLYPSNIRPATPKSEDGPNSDRAKAPCGEREITVI